MKKDLLYKLGCGLATSEAGKVLYDHIAMDGRSTLASIKESDTAETIMKKWVRYKAIAQYARLVLGSIELYCANSGMRRPSWLLEALDEQGVYAGSGLNEALRAPNYTSSTGEGTGDINRDPE